MPDTFELPIDETNFTFFRCSLPDISLNLFLELSYAFLQLRFSSIASFLSQFEEFLFRSDGTSRIEIRVVRPFRKSGRDIDVTGVISFGFEASLLRDKFI